MQSALRFGLLASALLGLASASHAVLVDQWDFTTTVDTPDGTDLNGILSNNLTPLGASSGGLVTLQSNQLRFVSNNTDGSGNVSTFRTTDLNNDPIASGIVQLQYTIVAADFTNTGAADGSANIWFGFRDTSPSNNEFARARLRFDGVADQFVIQGVANTALATFAGTTISDLTLRLTLNLDDQTAADSYQMFYTLGAGAEQQILSTQLNATGGLQIDDFRTAQQITNGGTDWRIGDIVFVDNLSVQTLAAIPEASAPLLLAMVGSVMGGMWYVRKRWVNNAASA